MMKWTLLGGLLALVGVTELTFGSLIYAVVGLGIGLMLLGVALELVAVILERLGHRWGAIHHHGFSDRIHRSRP